MNWLLAVATGALLVLICPRFGFVWLAPFALVPLLTALAREWRPLYRFLFGYAAGIVHWFGICYWIAMVLDVHGALGPWLGWTTFVLFCLLKALHFGLFGLLAGVLMRHWYAVPAVAALWAGLESTQGPLTGFEWLMLGNAAVDMSLPMRLAPFAGVYGISFLFAMLSGLLVIVLPRRPRKLLMWALAFPVLVLLPDLPAPEAKPTHSVVLVQPNVPEAQKWTTGTAAVLKRRLLLMSMQAAVPAPALIVWPELPAPIYYADDHTLQNEIASLAKTTRAPVLLGTVATDSDGSPLNSAQLVSARGEPAGRYDKIYLVPFGEYVPKVFWWVNRITPEAGDFKPGERPGVFPLEGARMGVFICYESAVPRLVRDLARRGGEVFFNLSNDGYFFHTAAREQHLMLVRMRAAENRRWILRATNNGITAAIDPAGRLTAQLPPFEESAAQFAFSTVRETTFYSRHGDWFAWLCLAGAAVALVASQRPHYSPPTRAGSPARRRP